MILLTLTIIYLLTNIEGKITFHLPQFKESRRCPEPAYPGKSVPSKKNVKKLKDIMRKLFSPYFQVSGKSQYICLTSNDVKLLSKVT